MSKSSAYHHGQLPDTLMNLALRHIGASGTEKLSLRALAREAGVSSTAPYRHFPTKRCLLAAIATKGFRDLGTSTRAVVDQDTPVEERVVQIGLAYVNFAIKNPTSYHLMFGSVLGDFSEYSMLEEAATQAYGILLSQLVLLIEEKDLDLDQIELGGIVWSGMHGLASLMINKMANHDATNEAGQSVATLHQHTERAIRFLLIGLI